MPGELGSSGHAPAGRSRIVEPCKVAFGSKQLALGLLWQPVKQGLALRAQARMAGGGKGGFDLHARPAGNRQIGFARTQDELTPGMLAGATAVNAVGWGDNWLAAMKLPGSRGLWWIVAMRDSLIYEDQLHAAESAALAAFRRSLEAPHWEKVVAPPAWEVPGSAPAEFAEILALNSAVPLRRVNRLPGMLIWASAVVLLAGAVTFGWSEWSKLRESREALQQTASSVAVLRPAPPWEGAPSLPAFVLACATRMNKLLIMPSGWLVDALMCSWDGSSADAKVIWRRQRGSPAWLRAAALEVPDGVLTFAERDKRAELAVPVLIGKPDPVAQQTAGDLRFIESVLRHRLLSLGLEANLVRRSGSASGRRGYSPAHIDIGIKTSAAIAEYAQLIADLPGLVPEALAYRPATNIWHLTAKAYGTPDRETQSR